MFKDSLGPNHQRLVDCDGLKFSLIGGMERLVHVFLPSLSSSSGEQIRAKHTRPWTLHQHRLIYWWVMVDHDKKHTNK
jgi:hypothetical protein